MSRRPRRNHSSQFKAKVALAALKGDKTYINSRRAGLDGVTVSQSALARHLTKTWESFRFHSMNFDAFMIWVNNSKP